MKRYIPWLSLLLLVLVAFSVQGCFGIGDNGSSHSTPPNTKTITKSKTGQDVGVNQTQDLFKGKIYFTIDRNIWVYDGKGNTRQLTSGVDTRNPAISPNGKTLIFTIHFKDYDNLEFMSASGGSHHTLITGIGQYYQDAQFLKSTYHWIEQPTWSPDGSHIIFLTDLQKEDWYSLGNNSAYFNAPFLDLEVFSAPFKSQELTEKNPQMQIVAYASFGDGGDTDPSYRPGHPNQLIYTHYAYDSTGTQQVIQIFLVDSTMIATHPDVYSNPLKDPGVPITPANVQNIQPAFSPNGNAIAYVRRESSTSMALYVMPVPEGVTSDPTNPTVQQKALQPYAKSSFILRQQFISRPVWSSDGTQIAYISYDNGTFDLWLANINFDSKTARYSMKGSPVQLTTGGVDGDSRPFWTP